MRRHGAARLSSLFYLVSPITAVLGWFIFDEVLGPIAVAGMAIAILGVALARR
jgi:drug/metabolite transporter (DMT)-like permease